MYLLGNHTNQAWSAPSALITAGMGFGGQIGAEVTDFVMILNDAAAVRAFQQLGSVTLGGNLSIAAGPIGRNAEASGAANFKSVAPIFSYSKTKGLFAGVSLEGSVLIERRDANRKFYNAPVTAKQLLTGQFPAPPAADPLYRILNTRAFSGQDAPGDQMYNDIPIYGDEGGWEDDSGSPGGANRNRAGSLGRRETPRVAEPWRNNFSDEYDDLDEYDRQESQYKRQMYTPIYAAYVGSPRTIPILRLRDRIVRIRCLRMARSLLVQLPQSQSSLERTHLGEISISPNSHSMVNKAVILVSRKETLSKSQRAVVRGTYAPLLSADNRIGGQANLTERLGYFQQIIWRRNKTLYS
jgi:hypothetical protein